jgi:glycosyltransferase involved in cell wall biosynthesis
VSNSKKVLICTPVLLIGGTEMQTLNLVRGLVFAGYETTVCCYYEFDESLVETFRKEGAEVVLLGLNRPDGRFGAFQIINLIRKLSQTFKKHYPDIVHVQYLAPGFIPVLTAYLAGVKVLFATAHQPASPYGRKEKVLLRTAAKLSTAFFCVSQSAERSWFGDSAFWTPDLAKNGRNHFTIFNAVDCERIRATAQSVNAYHLKSSLDIAGRPAVGVVGRLRAEKGHAWLLDAMADVMKIIPDVVLLVVGDGPDREGLKRRAENLGISENVTWMGQKTIDEVYLLYAAMDVVVVPSLFEGFGLTAAEAMASGRPVVGSRVDGLCEVIIDNVTGYLVPVKDCVAMARHLVELLSNKSKAETMGQAGYRRVVENFGIERVSASINAVYHYYAD